MTSMHANIFGAACATLLITGCASTSQMRADSAQRASAPAPSTPPSAASSSGMPIPNEPITTPGIRKAYYVGQLIDPAHPELMYRPGVVFREELPERWNRNPTAARGAVSGVIAAVPDPAILPPSSPEMEQMIAQQRKVMQLLSDRNDDLAHALADAKSENAATVAALNQAATAAPPPPVASDTAAASPSGPGLAPPPATMPAPSAFGRLDLTRALVPNADGMIELSAEILDEVDRSEPNPFVKRYQSQTTFREIVINVSGASLGPRPTASVNGRLLNVGDTWEGFTVAAITRDAVYFQKEIFLLQIPLARTSGVTVRVPQ